jgi:hypothetical protein
MLAFSYAGYAHMLVFRTRGRPHTGYMPFILPPEVAIKVGDADADISLIFGVEMVDDNSSSLERTRLPNTQLRPHHLNRHIQFSLLQHPAVFDQHSLRRFRPGGISAAVPRAKTH